MPSFIVMANGIFGIISDSPIAVSCILLLFFRKFKIIVEKNVVVLCKNIEKNAGL